MFSICSALSSLGPLHDRSQPCFFIIRAIIIIISNEKLLLLSAEPYRDRVATTEVQNAWSSRDSRRLQIVPGSALAGNSNCKNRVTELRFLVISRQ